MAKDLENRNVTRTHDGKAGAHRIAPARFPARQPRTRIFAASASRNTGVDVVRSIPAPLPARPGQDQLREDLLRALDAKYTPDYEQLIRAYFDALGKWK